MLDAGEDTDRKRQGFQKSKRKADSGALRSGLYWIFLLLVMWMWRYVGILPDVWLYVIVLFFIFMDQFCISVFCPFQWLMQNKCCNTCRINNWGYCMAFSPLIFIHTFWTYSIVFLSFVTIFSGNIFTSNILKDFPIYIMPVSCAKTVILIAEESPHNSY